MEGGHVATDCPAKTSTDVVSRFGVLEGERIGEDCFWGSEEGEGWWKMAGIGVVKATDYELVVEVGLRVPSYNKHPDCIGGGVAVVCSEWREEHAGDGLCGGAHCRVNEMYICVMRND